MGDHLKCVRTQAGGVECKYICKGSLRSHVLAVGWRTSGESEWKKSIRKGLVCHGILELIW